MKKIKNLNWWNININRKKTRADLVKSFDKKLFSQGEISKRVENEICKKLKSKYCILTPSGTAAIFLSLLYFKIKINDPKKNEVIISDRSWISPAHAAYFLNLKLSFLGMSDVVSATMDELTASNKLDQVVELEAVMEIDLLARSVAKEYVEKY